MGIHVCTLSSALILAYEGRKKKKTLPLSFTSIDPNIQTTRSHIHFKIQLVDPNNALKFDHLFLHPPYLLPSPLKEYVEDQNTPYYPLLGLFILHPALSYKPTLAFISLSLLFFLRLCTLYSSLRVRVHVRTPSSS